MTIDNQYQVKWTKTASHSFAELFNIDHLQVASKAKLLLEKDPFNQAYGAADYSNFKYNGYFWIEINNVILVYSINNKQNNVRIRACYSAITGFALKAFYGEYDPL